MHQPWHPEALFGVALVASFLMVSGCSKKDANEKLGETMSERMLERATGGVADVDIDGQNVSIKTKDANVQMTSTDKWPSDMFPSIPQFSYGKVERVTTGVEEGMKKFNIWLRDVPDDASDQYDAELKAAGWESQITIMSEQGDMLNAQKGTLAVQFMHAKHNKTGVFIAYEVSE
jgi:hypothetical protein